MLFRGNDDGSAVGRVTRRALLGAAAFASGALTIWSGDAGASGNGTERDGVNAGGDGDDGDRGGDAGASDDGSDDDSVGSFRARIYSYDFYPRARFRVVSQPLEYTPDINLQEGEAFLATFYWEGHETRVVQYDNTGEQALFFPPDDAGVRAGRTYRTSAIQSGEENPEGILTVGVVELRKSEETTTEGG